MIGKEILANPEEQVCYDSGQIASKRSGIHHKIVITFLEKGEMF